MNATCLTEDKLQKASGPLGFTTSDKRKRLHGRYLQCDVTGVGHSTLLRANLRATARKTL